MIYVVYGIYAMIRNPHEKNKHQIKGNGIAGEEERGMKQEKEIGYFNYLSNKANMTKS